MTGSVSNGSLGGSPAPDEPPLVDQVARLLGSLPLAVLELDDQGQRVVRVNDVLCAMVGIDDRRVLEEGAPFTWLTEDQAEVLEQLVEAADDIPIIRRRLVLRDRQDNEVVTVAAASTLTGADGKAQTFVVLEGLGGVERILMSDYERARFVLQLASERDRIARDLHDRVVQRLFAIGMELEAAAELHNGGVDVRDRLWRAVEDIDASMSEIRSTIFTLHRPTQVSSSPLETLQATVEAAGRLLGCAPELLVSGPLTTVPAPLIDQVNAVVRELLTNVVKHADGDAAWVGVTVDEGWVTVTVEDDGDGGGRTEAWGRGTGLRSLVERANALGGWADIGPRSPRGTVVRWSVPLVAPSSS